MIPPAIDARQLAAEIGAAVAEFNRLASLAASVHVRVLAELDVQVMPSAVERPVLRVQVIAP